MINMEVNSMKALRLILLVFCISFVITGVSFSVDVVNMVRNPSFEDGTGEWQLLITAPAAAKWEVVKDGVSGKCVKVSVTAVSGTGWHVEIHQSGQILKLGQEYTFNFWAKTIEGEARVVQPGMEGIGGAGDWWQDANIKGEWTEFSKTWIQALAGNSTIHFVVAQTKGDFLLDHVRLYEGKYQKEELGKEQLKAIELKGNLATTWGNVRKS
jgi:hypothetical protein